MLSVQPEASEPSQPEQEGGRLPSPNWLPRIPSVLLMPDGCSDDFLSTLYFSQTS